MQATPARAMKDRLRADLKLALSARRHAEAAVLRTLIAAIDNGEAAPISEECPPIDRHAFVSGSAEIARLALSVDQVSGILAAEIEKRDEATAAFEQVGDKDRAQSSRDEAAVVRRYIEE